MLLARFPEHGLRGADRLTLAVGSADPARSADDREELSPSGRMASHDPSGTDLDHHHVGVTGEASDAGSNAPGRGHLALALELDSPHAAASINLLASANCSSLSRMCECRQMLCGKTPAASTGGASCRSPTSTSGWIGKPHAQRSRSGSFSGSPVTSTTPKIACQTAA